VLQKVFKHDVAVVKYNREKYDKNRFRNGSPVEIEWGYFPAKIEFFVGQVHHTETKIENQRRFMYVYCIGASYPMDEEIGVTGYINPTSASGGSPDPGTGDPTSPIYNPLDPGTDPENGLCCDPMSEDFAAVLSGLTPTSVISLLAADQDFDVVLDNPDTSSADSLDVPMTYATPGESKWAFAVRLAMKNGFVFYVNKTTMHFYDPVKFINLQRTTFPLVRINLKRVTKLAPVESFQIIHSDDGNTGVHAHDPTLKQDNRRHVIRGVNPRTGAVIEKAGKLPISTLAGKQHVPRFHRTHPEEPAHTAGEAQQRASAHQRRHRWKYHAKVTARGQAKVHQGHGVYLQGVAGQDDGVWFVLGVEHDLTMAVNRNFNYVMHMDLARDTTARKGVGVPRSATTSVNRAVRPLTTPDQRRGKTSSTSLFLNGKWRSAFRRITILGKSSTTA
jgi:hypothetical protein